MLGLSTIGLITARDRGEPLLPKGIPLDDQLKLFITKLYVSITHK
jgi:hypothetical protein